MLWWHFLRIYIWTFDAKKYNFEPKAEILDFLKRRNAYNQMETRTWESNHLIFVSHLLLFYSFYSFIYF